MKRTLGIGFMVVAIAFAFASAASAGWNVNITIPVPGLFYYAPQAAPAPGYYRYSAPVAAPVLYGGYYYRPAGGRWLVAVEAVGPWYGIATEYVPVAVLQGPGYVYTPAGQAPNGMYIAPRLYYDGGGGGHHGSGHDD